ncbi:hypothetical protein BB561_002682 [Smittium simulii]|uniref:Anaphase-promoting complex subunit 4 WD40 domain-containing protein n=1 Tax=Smittium simulii TaxID=133385 RepID=A0A2T9YPH5_9FUNG|nr:hypothetical protein BB561_002682 [Smittium simulii]
MKETKPKKEICNYYTPWQVGTLAWLETQDVNHFCFAVGSLAENTKNYIQIAELSPLHSAEKDEEIDDFTMVAEHVVDYPVTKILWKPVDYGINNNAELLATTGDMLRIWTSESTGILNEDNCINRSLTQNFSLSTKSSNIAPLTSMDWNKIDSRNIITSSVDTTCTVWDIETQQAKTQLIAHDKEVYDVKFIPNTTDLFYTCGADGSVRMFDLRNLDHSTIVYEERPSIYPKAQLNSSGDFSANGLGTFSLPLLRISTSILDPNYLSVLALDSNQVSIIDLRVPGVALAQLSGHKSAVTSCEWSPINRYQLATSSTDNNILVWDISSTATGKLGSSNNNTQSKSEARINQPNDASIGPSSSFNAQQGYEGNMDPKLFWTKPTNFSDNKSFEKVGSTSQPQVGYTPDATDISPSLTYTAGMPINTLSWNTTNHDWIGIAYGYTVQVLRL